MLNSYLRSVGNLPTHPHLDDGHETRGPDEVANVNGSRLQMFAFPLPQVAAQVQNVADGADKLPQIEPTENAVDRKPLRATRLRQSCIKQAFEGKLVPQDPTEEPARLLLERLRASRSENDEKKRGDNYCSPRKSKKRGKDGR